ncbi:MULTISPECIES: LysE family translocator [unclassified Vibrio]|uniref:LysE family translocator n=1 Tax=Vibrio sp. HB236076 TaxID=3232307 RepID=A0AB39HDH0_9VIBR|nr:LysE family translocator [Vibrio sp. HB161653]MDP5254957.1 LysE family translocator [Vibrio sp. HB161653]
MSIVNLESFLIAITILTLTPGLDTALVIRNTSRSGLTGGCMTSLGICLGLFVHATFSAVGIATILSQSAQLFQWVKMAGALYLIYLGISGFRALLSPQTSLNLKSYGLVSENRVKSLREGFLSNVLNPKTAVFYLAFLPQFVDPKGSALLQSLTMAGIHFLIAMVWQCGLASVLSKAKSLLSSPVFMRWMEGTTSLVLVVLGVKLMLEKPQV